MSQANYTERPYKIRAEQYHVGAVPLPVGVCVCTTNMAYRDGTPHVHTARGTFAPVEGDWIAEDVWSPHEWHVIPDAEFTDRFAGPPGA